MIGALAASRILHPNSTKTKKKQGLHRNLAGVLSSNSIKDQKNKQKKRSFPQFKYFSYRYHNQRFLLEID